MVLRPASLRFGFTSILEIFCLKSTNVDQTPTEDALKASSLLRGVVPKELVVYLLFTDSFISKRYILQIYEIALLIDVNANF